MDWVVAHIGPEAGSGVGPVRSWSRLGLGALEGRQPRRALERGAVNGASGCALLVAEEEELDAGA